MKYEAAALLIGICLKELRELRAAGVRTFEEAEEHEARKRKQGDTGRPPMDWQQRFASRLGAEEPSAASLVA